jgi:hypothetical protein
MVGEGVVERDQPSAHLFNEFAQWLGLGGALHPDAPF